MWRKEGGSWFPLCCGILRYPHKGPETVQERELAPVHLFQLESLLSSGFPILVCHSSDCLPRGEGGTDATRNEDGCSGLALTVRPGPPSQAGAEGGREGMPESRWGSGQVAEDTLRAKPESSPGEGPACQQI